MKFECYGSLWAHQQERIMHGGFTQAEACRSCARTNSRAILYLRGSAVPPLRPAEPVHGWCDRGHTKAMSTRCFQGVRVRHRYCGKGGWHAPTDTLRVRGLYHVELHLAGRRGMSMWVVFGLGDSLQFISLFQ